MGCSTHPLLAAMQGCEHVNKDMKLPTVVGSGIDYRKVLKIGNFWTLLYSSATSDVQEKGKSIPLALSNAAASSTFGDFSDDEQAILIGQGEQSPSMHAGQGASSVARASQTGVEETSGAASLG